MLPQNNPTVSASSLTTTAWWPMPACSCRPPLHSTWGLRELVDHHLDLGCAPGRANTGDKLLTLVASALAGGDFIDDGWRLLVEAYPSNEGIIVRRPPSWRPWAQGHGSPRPTVGECHKFVGQMTRMLFNGVGVNRGRPMGRPRWSHLKLLSRRQETGNRSVVPAGRSSKTASCRGWPVD